MCVTGVGSACMRVAVHTLSRSLRPNPEPTTHQIPDRCARYVLRRSLSVLHYPSFVYASVLTDGGRVSVFRLNNTSHTVTVDC